MRVLGLVPARSGSSEVKHKNIRMLGGNPLMYYAVHEGLASSLDRVVLSTDSTDFLDMGKSFGADTPFLRPHNLSTNTASTFDVIIHCLDFLAKSENYIPDAVFLLRPTSPFRTYSQINEAIDLLERKKVDSVSAMECVAQHPYFIFKKDLEGKMVEYDTTKNKPERRQDLPEFWLSNCHTMLSTTEYLYKEHKKSGKNVINFKNFLPYIVEGNSSIDIDTEEDFLYAELMMDQINKKNYE
jgi:CMP-N-acetylneuraminic acid synthetase